MCRFICGLMLFAIVAGNASSVWGADPVTPKHLVGHEDIALLDRVQDLIDDWDPRKLVNPVFENVEVRLPGGGIATRKVLKRPDLAEFIADVEAAEVLGKALFWEMQAGSDYRRLADGTYVGTACASCHYRNGADARSRHTMRIPYVAWDQFKLAEGHPLEFGEHQLPYDVRASAVYESTFAEPSPFGVLSLTVGSAGVEPRLFEGLNVQPTDDSTPWDSEQSSKRTVEDYRDYLKGRRPQWSMFLDGQVDDGRAFRQITPRNSPSVMNAGFADRLFHDGRAESTFNGFSIFGDRDQRPVLWRGVPVRDDRGQIVTDEQGIPKYGKPVQVHVAIPQAALASQAVGPILSDVEMSYLGRTFPNVACKLLDAPILPHQTVDDTDNVLGAWKRAGLLGNPASQFHYRQLIQRAFRREWWDAGLAPAKGDQEPKPYEVPLTLLVEHEVTADLNENDIPTGDMMVANFPLYWGLSIMIYEASLVSNNSPFDQMMLGNSLLVEERWEQVRGDLGTIRLDRVMVDQVPAPEHKTGSAVFQHGFRVFLNRGCFECHGGPLFSEIYERAPDFEAFPIHEQLETALLPNSRADAIAVERSEFHRQTLDAVTSLLVDIPMATADARRLARTLDAQRELARGDRELLKKLIEQKLATGGSALGEPIADLLWRFERNAPLHFGNRTFFTEDERVELAELILEPVLVELMPIPPRQVRHRPRLPIQGPLATTDYAFYDLGFYAIGNSPPRYDAGVGIWEQPNSSDAVFELVKRELELERVSAPTATESERAMRNSLEEALSELRLSKGKYQIPDPAIREQLESRLQFAAERLMMNLPTPATPGASNRFRGSSHYESLTLEAEVEHRGRPCEVGPAVPADEFEKDWMMPEDNSWNRNYLPQNRRRSDLVFYSRARTSVSNEEPWGYRKPLLHDDELAFWGAFKTPSLRNVELTAPYMHNGRLESLADVIDFYDDGGDIEADLLNYPDKHPEIVGLDLTENDKKALLFFMICLTDERVRREAAPFDHPSLQLVHGYSDTLEERVFEVAPIGARGWTDPTKIPSPFPNRQ